MPFPLLQYYSRNSGGISLGAIVFLFLVAIVVYTVIKASRTNKVVNSHWHHMFDAVLFSPQELYQQVEELVRTWEIRGLNLSRTVHSQGGILTAKREYLRVNYKEYAFDICAAPFGKGYFVSWWMWTVEAGDPFRDFLVNLPIFGRLFQKRTKTFYELDTELMFKEAVKSSVKESIETLTTTKGLRKLADTEWQAYNRQY